MALGNKLRMILDERGLTVKDFAKKIQIPPTTLYSFIKRDSQTGKLELIAKICKGLDMDISDFLDDDLFDAATSPDAEYEDKLIDAKMKSIIESKNYSEKEKEVLLQNLMSQIEIIANMHKGNAEAANKYIINQLLNQLNLEGQKKAIEQIEMLTKIKEYQVEQVVDTLSKSLKDGHLRIGNKDNSFNTVAAHNPDVPEEAPEDSADHINADISSESKTRLYSGQHFTNIKEAKEYLLSQNYLAAFKKNDADLSDLDIIKIANEIYGNNKE